MFLSTFRASSEDGASSRSPVSDFWFNALGSVAAALGINLGPQRSMMDPAVWACVNVLAKSLAVMPFDVYAMKEGGGRIKRRDHWLYRLIAKAPNRFQTPFEFRLMLMGHLALRGNAYCQITANNAGVITELLPLHPDRMVVEMLPNGSHRYRYQGEDGQTRYFTRDEIWHLRGLSSDGVMGLSPLEYARESIGEGLAMQRYATRFFENDARPGGGWIEAPNKFKDNATKRLFRESWQELQGGANRNKVAVLEGGMKFHQVGVNNKDAQFLEARGAKVAEICRWFGVPPHKIADLSRSTNNNIEHQSIEFWTDTMLPWAKLWESSIEFFLLGPDSGLDVQFDVDRMQRGDGKSRADRIVSLVNGGVMVPNEGREAEGLDPMPGLDKPRMPLNMATVDETGNPDNAADTAEDTAAVAPTPDRNSARLDAMVKANVSRLARRASKGGALEADVIADALAVSPSCAAWWAGVLSSMKDPDEESVRRCLLACANEKG